MKEFKEILSMDSQLEHEITEYGADTGERETFMAIWSAKYMDMEWPCYGDSLEIKDEFDRRLDALREKRK